MESNQMTVGQVLNKMRNALWAIFITDSLCMPVHWYYDVSRIKKDFGYLTYYADPKSQHPTTIMKLPSTTDPTVDIIGIKILHSKRDVYKKTNPHYHDGLQAGDVTLNSEIVKLTMDTIADNKKSQDSYNGDAFLENYIKFLTTPDTHNDSYADTHHRYFVTNYLRGNPLRKCCAEENHDTTAILSAKIITPALFAPLLDYFKNQKLELQSSVEVPKEIFEKCIKTAQEHLSLLFAGTKVQEHTESWARTMLNVVLGANLREAIQKYGSPTFGLDMEKLTKSGQEDDVIGGKVFTIACYTYGAFPLSYYLAYKYHNDFDKAIIVNCNLGGENVSRGAAIGSLVAAYNENLKNDSKWITGLRKTKELSESIENFLKL